MKNNIITPIYDKNGIFLRKNHSFICRSGRITKSQLKSIKKYWPLFGIDFQLIPLNFTSIFCSSSPVILEIGFGSGESLINNAINFPNKNFLGIEVYKSGIGSCLNYIKSYKIDNLKIICYDAVEVIDKMIVNNSLSKIQIFFPDPWPKHRHHKRRMIQASFLKKVLKKLIIGGILHIATDSENYSDYILQTIKYIKNYIKLPKNKFFSELVMLRKATKFEKKAHSLGNKIFDLIFISQK